jgi:hypothetical protein
VGGIEEQLGWLVWWCGSSFCMHAAPDASSSACPHLLCAAHRPRQVPWQGAAPHRRTG